MYYILLYVNNCLIYDIIGIVKFFFHPSKLFLLEKIVSSVLMTVGYTLYVRVNPYGIDMFYQLSLYVWEENIGLSCIVLDFVKNLNIKHPEAFSNIIQILN